MICIIYFLKKLDSGVWKLFLYLFGEDEESSDM
jgi:hypothetical protein